MSTNTFMPNEKDSGYARLHQPVRSGGAMLALALRVRRRDAFVLGGPLVPAN